MKTTSVKRFYTVDDVMVLLGVKESKAYQVIRRLNAELEERGYITVGGKIPTKFFDERYYC